MKIKNYKITKEEIKKALQHSGYLLEVRIENILLETDFIVETNFLYEDNITYKSREFDIFAQKHSVVSMENDSFITYNLVIECINNPQPIAIIIKAENNKYPYYSNSGIFSTGQPQMLITNQKQKSKSITEYLDIINFKRFDNIPLGSQFCSFHDKNKKKQTEEKDWFAFHEDEHFNSFKTLSQAMKYLSNNITYKPKSNVYINVFVPIIVLQGELLTVEHNNGKIKIDSVKHAKYQSREIIDNNQLYYYVDVVKESYFNNLIDLINVEPDTLILQIKNDFQLLKDSAEIELKGPKIRSI